MLVGILRKFVFLFQRAMAHLDLRENLKYHTLHIPISVISVNLHYEQLCRAPTSANHGILLWFSATLNFFKTFKMFFSAKKELFS